MDAICESDLRAARYRSLSILLHIWDGGRFSLVLHLERLLSLRRPERPCVVTLLAFELVGHPDQSAVDRGAVVAGEINDPGFDHEAAEFYQMPCALAALDLPGAHVMSCPRRLASVARRPVAVERRQRRGQALMQFGVTGPERRQPRA